MASKTCDSTTLRSLSSMDDQRDATGHVKCRCMSQAYSFQVANLHGFRAVLTVRERGVTDFQGGKGDTNTLFRSYNHRPRLPYNSGEFNPKTLHHSKLAIHEACSATTAAPTYFHSVHLRGRRYIDGGLWANNPAMVAWNEAVYMGESPNGVATNGNIEVSPPVMPKMLLSIGTGARSEASRFGISILNYSLRCITSTTKEEERARETLRIIPGSEYFRLDVPDTQIPGEGLSKIGLAECKKKRIRRLFRKNGVETTTQNGNSRTSSSSPDGTQSITTFDEAINIARDRDSNLRRLAAIRHTHFEPHNFDYKTFDRIRDRTIQYIHHLERDPALGRTDIDRCAHLLWETSRRRRNLTEDRWEAFRKHPDPRFPLR